MRRQLPGVAPLLTKSHPLTLNLSPDGGEGSEAHEADPHRKGESDQR